MCVSAPNIFSFYLTSCNLVEEEFRIRRRNQHSMLMFFSQMNQQNMLRRWRRAWLWPHSQNWFCSLLANPALNFLWKENFPAGFSCPWKEHVLVLESQASSKQVVQKWCVRCTSLACSDISSKSTFWLTFNFLKLFWWCVSAPVRMGWTRLGSVLRLFWTPYIATATK